MTGFQGTYMFVVGFLSGNAAMAFFLNNNIVLRGYRRSIDDPVNLAIHEIFTQRLRIYDQEVADENYNEIGDIFLQRWHTTNREKAGKIPYVIQRFERCWAHFPERYSREREYCLRPLQEAQLVWMAQVEKEQREKNERIYEKLKNR